LCHVDARDVAIPEAGQHLVKPAEAAADIQHPEPIERDAAHDVPHRLWPTGGEEALTQMSCSMVNMRSSYSCSAVFIDPHAPVPLLQRTNAAVLARFKRYITELQQVTQVIS
jgi:hypothetical protein